MSFISRSLRSNKKHQKFQLKLLRFQRLKRYLNKTPYENQIRKFKNYCQVTGAAHSYHSLFGLSRHSLRKFSCFGFLPGVQKSSW